MAFAKAAVPGFSIPDDRNKRGDDKKAKAKREDTTHFELSQDVMATDMEESPDTCLITFPSHDLYASWDENTAHPYNFNESFKQDSVVITLVQPGDSAFVLPFKGDLTSLFGWRKYRPHYGTDIKLITGEKVASAFDGMVRLAKYYYGYGNCVIIRHNNGLETVYAHLSKILVEPGQVVNAGSVVGLGGNTGRSFGSHLHFEMRYLGQALDSQDFIDFEKGTLKCNEFVLRKCDVENKYNLRALHNRHRHDVGLARYSKGPAKAVNGTYVIRQGDNLWDIARKNKTTVQSICQKNRIKPNTTLRLGQKIKI
jgi:murein DD-endopeptidase MepM/ murein hydrolase activator NlpD